MNQKADKPSLLILFLRFKNWIVSRIRNFQKRILVFLFFLLLATISWFSRALNETYVADIKYPISYINFPSNRILTKEPPEELTLRVRSDGYTILSNKLKFKFPLPFDVNSFSLYSLDDDSQGVYILSRYAKDRLNNELNKKNKNINILEISPDTIFFNFTWAKKKMLPVKALIEPDGNLFARQYMQNGPISISPDSIEVQGPATIVDSLQYINTVPLNLVELNDTIIKTARLGLEGNVNLSHKKVKVTIPVDRFTESSFDIPISFANAPDSLQPKTFPSEVRISFLVTLSRFDDAKPELFKPYIDFNDANQDDNRARIKLDSIPEFVNAVKLHPNVVEYLLEKKNAEDWADRRDR